MELQYEHQEVMTGGGGAFDFFPSKILVANYLPLNFKSRLQMSSFIREH